MWLRAVVEPMRHWLLGREIGAHLAAYGEACVGPDIVAAAPDVH
ncbi:hypothetical protein [Flexivirga endophytica]|nr:hypothetical protein [Flexivirga endophytica]